MRSDNTAAWLIILTALILVISLISGCKQTKKSGVLAVSPRGLFPTRVYSRDSRGFMWVAYLDRQGKIIHVDLIGRSR